MIRRYSATRKLHSATRRRLTVRTQERQRGQLDTPSGTAIPHDGQCKSDTAYPLPKLPITQQQVPRPILRVSGMPAPGLKVLEDSEEKEDCGDLHGRKMDRGWQERTVWARLAPARKWTLAYAWQS
jgi:hypothetical protein